MIALELSGVRRFLYKRRSKMNNRKTLRCLLATMDIEWWRIRDHFGFRWAGPGTE